MSTLDGFQYTEANGLVKGLPSKAAQSQLISRADESTIYDVIIIGAGYAGLIATRELALQGKRVLLLEARDRIGGRTWTSEIEGYPYEMGGTWVHWNQAHVYTEITRYGLQDQIEASQDYTRGLNHYSLTVDDVTRTMSHDEEGALFEKVMGIYCNIDGAMARTVIPFPHDPLRNRQEAEKWGRLSALDRINQVRHQLNKEDIAIIESMVMHISGGTLENTGFWDILRWWALCGYTAAGNEEYGLTYKLKCGQSGLANAIFSEAKTSPTLAYRFSFPIAKVVDADSFVEVIGRNHEKYTARRLISTIPQNVLSDVEFDPPLSPGKASAARIGQVNMAAKVHCEVKGHDLRSWSGTTYPGRGLLYAYGDGTTPAGNTHVVAFGAEAPVQLHAEDNIEKTKAALLHFHDMEINRLVFHNWARDEFAKGAWCVWRPGFEFDFLDALQMPSGKIHFANADWAHGWRGFIDGAIEQGKRSAFLVAQELRLAEGTRL